MNPPIGRRYLNGIGIAALLRADDKVTAAITLTKSKVMAVLKVIELLAESDKSWEDAVQKAVAEASKTLHGIKSVWVKNQTAEVANGKVTSYRLNCHITFELDGDRKAKKKG